MGPWIESKAYPLAGSRDTYSEVKRAEKMDIERNASMNDDSDAGLGRGSQFAHHSTAEREGEGTSFSFARVAVDGARGYTDGRGDADGRGGTDETGGTNGKGGTFGAGKPGWTDICSSDSEAEGDKTRLVLPAIKPLPGVTVRYQDGSFSNTRYRYLHPIY